MNDCLLFGCKNATDDVLNKPYDPQTFGYIEIGTIVGAHGVAGWMKVKGTSDTEIITNELLEIQKRRLCTGGIRHIKGIDAACVFVTGNLYENF